MLGTIRNKAGEKLDYSAAWTNSPDEVVIVGHGVTGNKDRPWAVALTSALKQAGTSSLRFSFAGNGESEGRFVDSTLTKEVSDLGSVLDAIRAEAALDDCGLTYIGHSMGGAVGVLRAAQDQRLGRLASLAGMVDTRAFAERKFGDLRPDEDTMWGIPECPLSSAFMADMERVGSVLTGASRVSIPWLLVHGTDDQVVPISDSRDVHGIAPMSELVELEGADHVFSGEATDRMIVEVLAWLDRTS